MNYLGLFGLLFVGFNRLNKCNENLKNGLPAITNKDIIEIGLFLSSYGLSSSFKHNKSLDDISDGISICSNLIS